MSGHSASSRSGIFSNIRWARCCHDHCLCLQSEVSSKWSELATVLWKCSSRWISVDMQTQMSRRIPTESGLLESVTVTDFANDARSLSYVSVVKW